MTQDGHQVLAPTDLGVAIVSLVTVLGLEPETPGDFQGFPQGVVHALSKGELTIPLFYDAGDADQFLDRLFQGSTLILQMLLDWGSHSYLL